MGSVIGHGMVRSGGRVQKMRFWSDSRSQRSPVKPALQKHRPMLMHTLVLLTAPPAIASESGYSDWVFPLLMVIFSSPHLNSYDLKLFFQHWMRVAETYGSFVRISQSGFIHASEFSCLEI